MFLLHNAIDEKSSFLNSYNSHLEFGVTFGELDFFFILFI